ncbi:hypothetical protein AB1L88_10895 [Tautonia sp. JC769]|uniref:hypothetical protein n=1 Tax=Tautonia sp. JC769 TaxID=3232135 RepID=UPI003458D2A4
MTRTIRGSRSSPIASPTPSTGWMPRTPQPTSDIALLDDLGGCFEALAKASALARSISGQGGRREKSLKVLAEARSAVRSVLQRLNVLEDHDQLAAS